VTYAESGLFWSQCFLPSLIIRKAQAGAGKSSLGLCGCTSDKHAFFGKSIMKSDPTCLNCNSTPDYRVERHDININLRVLFTISCCKFTVNFITQSYNFKTLQTRSFPTPLTVTIKFTSQNLGGT
jgi:hypothetical protein